MSMTHKFRMSCFSYVEWVVIGGLGSVSFFFFLQIVVEAGKCFEYGNQLFVLSEPQHSISNNQSKCRSVLL